MGALYHYWLSNAILVYSYANCRINKGGGLSLFLFYWKILFFLIHTLHIQELYLKDECGVPRDRAVILTAIAKLRRNREFTLPTDLHAYHAFIPTLDYIASAQHEREWLNVIEFRVHVTINVFPFVNIPV